MSKANRQDKTEQTEQTGGNVPTMLKQAELDVYEDTEGDLRYLATRCAPEEWPAWVLRELGKRAVMGPWRNAGHNFDDWGAVPGTKEGAHRYYFGAIRGRGDFGGTIVANSVKTVERWLRDQERAEGYASRDPRRACDPERYERVFGKIGK